MTLEQAGRACRHGAYAAFASSALTLVVMLVAMSSVSSDVRLAPFNDAWLLVDVIVLWLCGLGLLKRSRLAASFVFVYWGLSCALEWSEAGQLRQLVLGLAALLFYGRAVWGAFVYHRLRKAADPDYVASPRWLRRFGAVVVVLTIGVLGLGLLELTGAFPSMAVVEGARLAADDRAALVDGGIIEPNERVLFFYSDDLWSVREAGNVLTDWRVIRYGDGENGECVAYELATGDIAAVERDEADDFLGHHVYRVVGREPDVWFQLALSTEDGGDEAFVRAIRARIE